MTREGSIREEKTREFAHRDTTPRDNLQRENVNRDEANREAIIAGLDIGTTKIGAVIALGEPNGRISITGVGMAPSRGVKKGVVVDVEETVGAIREAVNRASLMAGTKVEGVVAGVTGDHFASFNRRGSVTVAARTGMVGPADIERALQAAILDVPRDREIVHALPRSFSVDGQTGIAQPIGLSGMRLEAETHVVTGKSVFLYNTVQCIERAGLRVESLVMEPLATAEAVLSPDEREMGVLLVDIGGGTSDMAAWHNGVLSFSAALPVGGHHVTRDIAIGLRTPFEWAERLKIDSGAAIRNLIPDGEALEVVTAGGAERLRIPRSLLGEITEARMSELFEIARSMLLNAGFNAPLRRHFGGGVVISGGGALLPGVPELAEAILGVPARLGTPNRVTGWSDAVSTPQFSTSVGLCQFAMRQLWGHEWRVFSPLLTSRDGRRIWGALKPLTVPAAPVVPVTTTTTPTTSLPRQEAAQSFSAPRFVPNRPETRPEMRQETRAVERPAERLAPQRNGENPGQEKPATEKAIADSPVERLRRHDEIKRDEIKRDEVKVAEPQTAPPQEGISRPVAKPSEAAGQQAAPSASPAASVSTPTQPQPESQPQQKPQTPAPAVPAKVPQTTRANLRDELFKAEASSTASEKTPENKTPEGEGKAENTSWNWVVSKLRWLAGLDD